MCGIGGWLSWGQPPKTEVVDRMIARITQRGPDHSYV